MVAVWYNLTASCWLEKRDIPFCQSERIDNPSWLQLSNEKNFFIYKEIEK